MRFYTEEDTRGFEDVHFLYLKTILKGHIFQIILNRPEKRNAFTPTMSEEITYALAYAHYNSNIRCVIVSAEGPVFCAGADLIAFQDPDGNVKNDTLPKVRGEVKLGDAFAQLLKPSIAVVEGPVLAGGFLIICGCTFVLSVKEATFGLPEVKRGIWPMQVMASLLQVIPQRKILEMAITGKSYDAGEAYQLGLITQIVDKEEIATEVNNLSKIICSNAPYAIRTGMEALQNLHTLPETEYHSYLKQQLDILLTSADAREGAAAFREKRNPFWQGK